MMKPSNAAKPRESKRQLVLHKLEKLAASTPYLPEAEAFRAKAEELKIHTEHVQITPVVEGRSEGAITIGHSRSSSRMDGNAGCWRHHPLSRSFSAGSSTSTWPRFPSMRPRPPFAPALPSFSTLALMPGSA